ncbi:MAG: hypothetical protein ACSLFP_07290 [Acidimicrobiales bacterium]
MLRTRLLAGAVALALTTVSALPAALAGNPILQGDVVVTPDPVVVGATTVVTPVEGDECLVFAFPTGVGSAAGPVPAPDLRWQIKDLSNPSELVDSGNVAVEPDGTWAVPIDTTGFAPGSYDFFAECTFSTVTSLRSTAAAGGPPVQTIIEYEGLFDVVAPATPETPTPTAPVEPPAALPVQAAPDFTG